MQKVVAVEQYTIYQKNLENPPKNQKSHLYQKNIWSILQIPLIKITAGIVVRLVMVMNIVQNVVTNFNDVFAKSMMIENLANIMFVPFFA